MFLFNSIYADVLLIILLIAFIILQYKLCKGKNGRKKGLILPIMYFCISILAAGAFLATQYTETSCGYEDENGKEIVTEEDNNLDELFPSAAAIFISFNIPTVLLFIEHNILTSKSKKNSELEAAEMAKTQIHDL